MNPPENRLSGRLDGALHLLDRQLVDSEDRLLGKADDVELTERDGALVLTGVLTGPAALLPRVAGGNAGRVLRAWRALRPSEPDRTEPWRIDIDLVDRLDSAIHLRVPRDGVIRRTRTSGTRRLSTLTGMDVLTPEGRYGRVLDVRFVPRADGSLAVESFVVGHGRPGSLLGYDRRGDQGPTLVRTVVRRLHRHSATVRAADAEVDWDAGEVRVGAVPEEAPGHPFG